MEKTEEELLFLISNLEAIIDNLPFDVWYKDVNGEYAIVNKAVADYMGCPKKEIIGKNDYELYPKESADIYVSGDYDIVGGKIQGYYESILEEDFYEEYKRPVFDESGKVIGITGFSRKITQSKKTKESLIENERSKAILLSNLPGVAFRCSIDPGFTVTYVSEGCYNLTGYTAEQLINMNPSYNQLIHPEYRDKLFEKWGSEKAENMASTDEYPISTASGETKWVWEQSQRIYDAEHNVIASEGFITDVTERKMAEKALRLSEERFRTIFEEAPLGIAILDSVTGYIQQMNNRYEEIVGIKAKKLLLMHWKNYSHPDELDAFQTKMQLVTDNLISGFSMDMRHIMSDGTYAWANVTMAGLQTDRGSNSRCLCMIEDITARKKAEEEIIYLSYYDQLTGLYNRRFYEEELKRIDTKRNLPITLVMADVNGLKLTNDAFGHTAGDMLLKKVAELIKKECRDDDIIARIGGDEFIILLPRTNGEDAEKMVNRINSSVLNEKVSNLVCSVSFGWETKNVITEDIGKVYISAENYMYRQKLSKSARMRNETIKVITETLYEKNIRERFHCQQVSQICEEIGIALGMSPQSIMELKMAGLLHDIGKIGIDEGVLNKEGEFNEAEWKSMRRHSEIGYHILRSVNEFVPIAEYVLHHHERIDGKGYPRKLDGNSIPLQSKIICIADSYDAMISERSYKKIRSEEEAVEELLNNAYTQFDGDILKVFIEKVLRK